MPNGSNELFRLDIDTLKAERALDRLEHSLEMKDAQRNIRQLEDRIDRMGGAAGRAGKRGATSMLAMGAGIGSAIVLVTELVNVIKAGVVAFKDLSLEALELASQSEIASITFTNIFKKNEAAATAFLGGLQEQALDLGTSFRDLQGFSKSLLPDTQSIDEFERLTEIAVTLEKSDPDKTLNDVRIAFENALSGQLKPLLERFDLPGRLKRELQQAQKDGVLSVNELIAALQKEFEISGIDLESFRETFSASIDRVNSRFQIFKTELGKPFLDKVTEQVMRFDTFLKENHDTLVLVAGALGDVAGVVVELIGTGLNDWLEKSDPTKLLEVADALHDGVVIALEFGRALGELIISIVDIVTMFSPLRLAVGEVADAEVDWAEATIKIIEVLDLSRAGLAGMIAVLKPATTGMVEFAKTMFFIAKKDYLSAWTSAIESVEDFSEVITEAQRGNEAFNAVLDRSEDRIKALRDSLGANNEALKARREEQGRDKTAEAELAAEILKTKDAVADLQKELEKEADASKALIDERAKLAEGFVEEEIKRSRKLIDNEIAESRRREDIVRRSAKTRADIFKKARDERTEALAGLGEEQSAAEEEASKAIEENTNDTNERLLAAEKKYREDLRSIQTTFERSARESAIRNDVTSFLSAKRTRDDSLTDAKSSHQQETKSIQAEGEKREGEIRQQREADRKELEEGLQERLKAIDENEEEELKSLQEQLNEQEAKHQLALERRAEDEALAGTRAEEDQLRSLEKMLEQLKEKHGDYIDVTAEGLLDQAKEYEKTYGAGGEADETMSEFFTRQQERLTEMSTSHQRIVSDLAAAEQRLEGFSGEGGEDVDRGEREPSPGARAGLGETPDVIGQTGLVSRLLANPSVSFGRAAQTSTINNTSTSNNRVEIDFKGVEPYLQSIAMQSVLEIIQNQQIAVQFNKRLRR